MVRALVCASLVLASLAPLVVSLMPAHAAWYNSSYLYKKAVTVDHTKVGLPQFDAVSAVQDKLNQASPLAWNHTIGTGSNTLLIVTVAYAAAKATTGVTFNSVAMTQVTGSPMACSASCNAEMWYLKNPASGTHSVSVAFPAGTVSMIAGSSSYQDVNQTTPIGTVATASNTTANMSNADGTTVGDQLIVDGFAANANTFTVNAAQTLNYESHTNAHGGSSYRASAGTSTTMTWVNTSTVWAEITAPINPADQANFPILVKEASDANLKTVGNGGSVRNASGFDMIFTDSTETTKLDHEIEYYMPTTGEIEMWVRIPTLSAAVDTVIYLYYDNASISTSQENKTGVWDANYKGVWHLSDNAANTTVNDSTANTNTGTNVANTSTKTTSGEIAGGLTYTGADKTDTTVASPAGGKTQVTVSAWVNFSLLNGLQHDLYMETTNGGATKTRLALVISGGGLGAAADRFTLYGRSNDGDAATIFIQNSSGLSTATWYYVVGVYDSVSGVNRLMINGVEQTNALAEGTFSATAASHVPVLGAQADGSQFLQGSLDETHVSTTARSTGWSTTEYKNQSSSSTFLTFGAAVGAPVVAITGVSPNSGPPSGGTSVVISGTSFTGAIAVKFGVTNATSYVVNSDLQITATAPAHASATVDITVTTPAGTSAVVGADQFTYVAAALTIVAPGGVTLPNVNPGTTSPTANAGTLTYTDTLNDATAWSVTFSATDFGAGTIPFTGFTIGVTTAANTTPGTGAVGVPTAGAASQTLAGADGVPGTTFSTPITLASAAGTVQGSYSTPAGGTGNTLTFVVPGTATGSGLVATAQYTITG